MINFYFIKSQFKIVKNPIIIFFILLLILTIPALTQEYFSPYRIVDKNDRYYYSTGGPGGSLFFTFFFFISSMILFPTFTIILINKVLLKEINKGYFCSWLATSMSRKAILNSKFFVILSSILFLNISILLIQLILFSSIFKDFNSKMALYLFLYFLSLIFFSILFTSITWFISCYFCDKQSLSISLISGILTVFFVFYVISNFISFIPNLENLKYLKYLTITTFLKPIIFGDPASNQGLNLGNIENFDYINFAWQMPVMLILFSGLFILGNWFFCKKDLHL